MSHYEYYQPQQSNYPVYNYGYENHQVYQHAVHAALTGAAVGAIAGAAHGLATTEGRDTERVVKVAKSAVRDSALCGASSFVGAAAAGISGTRGVLSMAIFAAAGIGTGYVLNKYLSDGCSSCNEETSSE